MKLFKLVITLFSFFTIAACTSARYSAKEGNYLKLSKTLPPTVVPAGVMALKQNPYYTVPSKTVLAKKGKAPSLKPPEL